MSAGYTVKVVGEPSASGSNRDFDHALRLAYHTAGRYAKGIDLPACAWEDLLQEARIAAWKAVQTFDPTKANFSTWVIKRCRWAIAEALRRESFVKRDGFRSAKKKGSGVERSPFFSLEWDFGEEEGQEWTSDHGEQARLTLTRLLICETAQEALAVCENENERRVACLHGMEGLSQGEVARRLGVPESQVHGTWKRLSARMRARLGAGEGLPSSPWNRTQPYKPLLAWVEEYLSLTEAGVPHGKAARAVGVLSRSICRHATRHPEFRERRDQARLLGEKAREGSS